MMSDNGQGTGDSQWAVPWHAGDALAVLGVTAVLSVMFAVSLAILGDVEELPGAARRIMLPLPLALLGVVTLGWIHVRYGAVGRLSGPLRPEARHIRQGVAWGTAGFFAVNVGISIVLQALARLADLELPQPQEQLRRIAMDPVILPWLLLTAVLIAPVSEELYFRGMLFQSLRTRLGAAGSIGTSAAIFAAAHVLAEPTGPAGLLVFVLVLPLGVLLGWLLERQGTLVAPIVAHSTFNLLTSLVLIAGRSGLMA